MKYATDNEHAWRELSAILSDTNEQHPLSIKEHPTFVHSEGFFGLSSLQQPCVEHLFQHEDGTMWAKIEGCDEVEDISDYTEEELIAILDALRNMGLHGEVL